MASAVDFTPTTYIALDEEAVSLPPLPKIAIDSESSTPNSANDLHSHFPHTYSRSTPQSQLSFGRQTIRLDESVPYPRPWDHDNDRPLGPIRLDDPQIGNTGRRGSMWRVARTAFSTVRIKLGAKAPAY